MTTETPAADIVERLRTRVNDAPLASEYLMDEAAIEIETLRALKAGHGV